MNENEQRPNGLVKEFEWTEFYSEFANALLLFSHDRIKLISRLQKCYKEIGMPFPKMDFDGNARDVDPFTVFGLFNRNRRGATDKCMRILAAIKDEFEIKSKVPELFNGIPVLDSRKACYFAFSNGSRRGKNDIDNLWRMFELAIDVAEGNAKSGKDFVDAWNTVIKQYGVGWNLTMGLYWIRPQFYVNLDRVNRDYMSKNAALTDKINEVAPKVLSGTMPKGSEYIAICEIIRNAIAEKQIGSGSLPEFSYNAWMKGKMSESADAHFVRQLGLGKPHFWHMQLHPGSDAEFSQGDVLEILNKYAVVGMGSEWENDGGQPRQFKEDMQEGDIIGIREKGFVALVRVAGACRKNNRQNKLNWFDIVRPIEILSVDADDYIRRYREETGMNAHDNLYNPATLSEVKPKCKNKFLRFWYDSVMGLNDADDANKDLRGEFELSNDDGGIESLYSKGKFLDEVFMSSQQYGELVGLLRRKKNIILRGAPGVGKTFAARRLAYSLIGSKDKTRTGFVQFHQSYSYENFIRGYKPTANGGFELRDGVFLEFCKKAEEHPDNDYFFIIDEINRGNLSKIFGELLVLIEGDKRGQYDYAVKLAYGDGGHDERFRVPSNLYLIGLMNTADRSLAMIDYALRRRFAFFTVEPALDNPKFRKQLTPELDRLVSAVEILNKTIEADPSLGKGFKIGHSYFCEKSEDGKLPRAQEILDYEIAPTLEEYWFEDPAKAQKEIEHLRKAIFA